MIYLLHVKGIVQGIGFRPFVYRLAKTLGLGGHVKNLGGIVEILLSGPQRNINQFIHQIKKMETVESVKILERYKGPHKKKFTILQSREEEFVSCITPDISLCETCKHEFYVTKNRRHGYEFIGCAQCGPRFAILKALPYDRENTSFAQFTPCDACKQEYADEKNRRFHAQLICCKRCGPKYTLYHQRKSIGGVLDAIDLIQEGKPILLQGVTGVHVVCDAKNPESIKKIRRLLDRPFQPFATLFRDLKEISKFAKYSKQEARLLTHHTKPIVIIKKTLDEDLISPGLDTIGACLPSTGLQLKILDKISPLIFTSANFPGLPMVLDFESSLSLPFKYRLFHDLKIENRCDDSVIRFSDNMPKFIRRSRGYAGRRIKIGGNLSVLALGAEINVTGCLTKAGYAWPTQHIGNVRHLEGLTFLKKACLTLAHHLNIQPEVIVSDMHPDFLTTQLAHEMSKGDIVHLQVQHHHAHAASVLAEQGLDQAIAIIADGIGYAGEEIWGGEVMYVDQDTYKWLGGLKKVPMPGGDLCTKYPLRMAMGFLSSITKLDEFSKYFKEDELKIIKKQVKSGLKTSSAGRFLDALAGLLGICTKRTYEGEPAIRLEAFGKKSLEKVSIPIKKNILDTPTLLYDIINLKIKPEEKAWLGQRALAQGLGKIGQAMAEEYDLPLIVSGGVMVNRLILKTLRQITPIHSNQLVPPGDGGLSLGQAWLGSRLSKS